MKFFEKEKGFVAYLTAGDGGIKYTEEAFLALIEGGVNCLEIGVPFSDPLADGPVIQRAMQRALSQGITPWDVLKLVSRLRKKTDVPIVLFSYFNPILAMGEDYIREAKASGVDSMLIVDMPLTIPFSFTQTLKAQMPLIRLITPNTVLSDIESGGFVYYVCRKGTTGMKKGMPEHFYQKIKEIKKKTKLPVVSGFGISNKEMAIETLKIADGFVVGSYFVHAIEEGASPNTLKELAKKLDPRRKR